MTSAAVPVPVPVTVIGGRWGAGKTGVVDRVARHLGEGVVVLCDGHHDHQHLGAEVIPIEQEVLIERRDEPAGAVRGDLLEAMGDLLARPVPPRHVLIEAVGGADLALVAQTLLRTSALRDRTRLGGLVTVVDGFAAGTSIATSGSPGLDAADVEALAVADLVVVNRLERLVPAVESRVAWELWGMCGARQTHIDGGPAGRDGLVQRILALPGFDPVRSAEALPARGHDHVLQPGLAPLRSVAVEVEGSLDLDRLDDWIGEIQQRAGRDLLRWRGRFAIRGRTRSWIGVGARTSTLIDDGPVAGSGRSVVQLVGRVPPAHELVAGLRGAVA